MPTITGILSELDKPGNQAPRNSRRSDAPQRQQPRSNESKPNNAFAQAFAKTKR